MPSIDIALVSCVDWVKQHPGSALALALVMQMFVLVLTSFWTLRITALMSKHKRLFRGASGADLESQILKAIQSASVSETRIEYLTKAIQRIDSSFVQGFRRVGLHRYDAVSNQGGNQSFSVALLDDAASGVVLSVIAGRAESRMYCKAVVRGESNLTLSDEETIAINRAEIPCQQGSG